VTTLEELQEKARGRGPEAKEARKQLLSAHSLNNSRATPRKRRKDPEGVEQRAYLDRLKWERPVVYEHTFSVPNERASKGEAGRLKALGVKTGIPDLLCILPSPSGVWRGLALEFKAPGREGERDGGRTPTQVEWGERFEAAGWLYAVVYSAASANEMVDQYMTEVSDEDG
jgi:hypothetical protein